MHNRGIVLRAIVALAAIVSLAGCSSLTAGAGGSGLGASAGSEIAREALQTPTAPTDGLCWQISYAEFLQEPEVANGVEVPCSSAHQAYTFVVNSLASDLQRADAASAANQSCGASYNTLFPNNIDAYRILLSETLPSVTQWAAGERWVRCDVQETAAGSLFRNPTFADLPTKFSIFVSSYTTSPSAYAMCIDEPGTTAVTGPAIGTGAIIADCTSAQWRLEPSPDLPDAPGVPYPGYTGLYPYMHAHCGALYDTATIRGWIFYPDNAHWTAGSRDFECWVGSR
ncbi:MAG TPA: septum formation family protein [Galbitalea sp.]|nr:septum formation family protein [Galbitalea sp.]